MKVCDKHPTVRAAYTIEFGVGETYDLCRDCTNHVKEYMIRPQDLGEGVDKEHKKVVKSNRKPRQTRKKKADAA